MNIIYLNSFLSSSPPSRSVGWVFQELYLELLHKPYSILLWLYKLLLLLINCFLKKPLDILGTFFSLVRGQTLWCMNHRRYANYKTQGTEQGSAEVGTSSKQRQHSLSSSGKKVEGVRPSFVLSENIGVRRKDVRLYLLALSFCLRCFMVA